MILAITSTAAQYLAAALAGFPIGPFDSGRSWSTGGLVAVTASIYMGVKCRTWDDFKRRIGIWIVTTGLLAFTAVSILAGFANAYSIEVVDQEKRAETFHEELTGKYDVIEVDDRICGNDEDYLSCLNQHVVLYNVVCANRNLTTEGADTCDELSDFIETIRKQYDRCGSGCRTRADENKLWGWPYLQSVPETVTISNNDGVPQISHLERCEFELGRLTIGICPRPGDR